MAINFLRACGKNYSIATARNAWVGDLVCLCVMENRSCTKQNGWWEVRIKGSMKERGGMFFLVCNFLVVVIFRLLG